jgi:hypothetical protein
MFYHRPPAPLFSIHSVPFLPVSCSGFLHKFASFYIFPPSLPPPSVINALPFHSINPAVIFLLTHPKQLDSYSPMHPMHN